MYSDVLNVQIVRHLEISVTFADGLSGRVLMQPSHLYGVFQRLQNPDFFRQINVTNGYVSWPGEIDLAPDAMYEAIKKNGEWILS
jgi:hypothetical protein